jgi:protein SCO1/2
VTRRALVVLCLLGSLFAGCRTGGDAPRQLYPVGEFSFTNQDGARFGSAELRGKVWVAAFFFTRCPTICPKITARMKWLGEQAKERKLGLELVSISVDPENDTPEVLREYAKKNGLDLAHWSLLTGDDEAIKKTTLEGFKVAVEGKADATAPDFGILHGSHLVLVDRVGQIRGYYRSSDDAEMHKLLDDVARVSK